MTSASKHSLRGYELRRVLGKGATGTVYEAVDEQSGTVVALKAIEPHLAEDLYRLKQEFRALADVQHKNLVRFGELSCDEGQWFFTMELVRGRSFLEYVRPGSGGGDDTPSGVVSLAVDESGQYASAPSLRGGYDEGRLRASLAQLVEALAAIHDAGQVHRDVKPSNVMVSDDHRVVLLDFGLAMRTASSDREAHEPMILGTPAFMAPEQVDGTPVGPPADFYAVGVMLYVALTGRLPFEGRLQEVLEAKLTRAPRAPRELLPHVPADLDALAMELLSPSPETRPRAADILERLGVSADGAAGGLGETSAFVGRGTELAFLKGAFGDAQKGRRRSIVVTGEPGMGKSALVQRFLGTVEGRGIVLRGRCYEQETVPFKGVDAIVDALSTYLLSLADDEAEELVGGGVRFLAAVFPVLGRVPVVADKTSGAREVDSQAALREQAFGELERLLAAIAAKSPLVIYLDDLQWADRDSAALLLRLLRGPSAPPCLFVATKRTGVELSRELTELVEGCERVKLGGLSEGEAKALWEALWTTHHTRPEARSSRDAAVREASGHPLFLAELVRTARAGKLPTLAGTRLPDVLWDRVCQRDETDQRFLHAVALAGTPVRLDILARAAGLDPGECGTRLGALRAAQLVRVTRRSDGRYVEPYHDRVREAIVAHGDPSTLASRHLALGRALLAGTDESARAARIFAIVFHLTAGAAELTRQEERDELAGLLLVAARQARLSTAYGRAAEHAQKGLALLGAEGPKRAYALARDLALEAMKASYLDGDRETAQARFAATEKVLSSIADRVELSMAWMELETGGGRFREAIEAGRAILKTLGAPLPRNATMASVLTQYGLTRWAQGRKDPDELLHLPVLGAGEVATIQKILLTLAAPSYFIDTPLLTWIMLRMTALTIEEGLTDVSSYGLAGYGMVLSAAFGKHEEGAAFGRVALALNERLANHKLGAKLHLLNGAFIVAWVRPFAESKELLRRSYQLALEHGDTSYEAYAATILSVHTFCESATLAGVEETARWAEKVSVRRKDRDMAGVPNAHARHAMTLQGRTPSPRDLGVAGSSDAELRASLDEKGTPITLFYYSFCNAELAYLAGDAERAAKLLEEAKTRVEGIFALPTTLELAFLEGLVAARRYESLGLTDRLRAGRTLAKSTAAVARWAKSCAANFEAHAHILQAERHRVSGDLASARAGFARAVTAAKAHGSPKREALALELWSDLEARANDAAQAAKLRSDAEAAYRRWGATTKADALRDQSPTNAPMDRKRR